MFLVLVDAMPWFLSMVLFLVDARSLFVLVSVNVSVVTLPRASHQACTGCDSDLPLRDAFVLSISSGRCIVDECANVPPIVPNLSSFIALQKVAVPVRSLFDHHDSEHLMVISGFRQRFHIF